MPITDATRKLAATNAISRSLERRGPELSALFEKWGGSVDLSLYAGYSKPIEFTCRCGSKRSAKVEHLLSGNNAPLCKECAAIERVSNQRAKGLDRKESSPVKQRISELCAIHGATPDLSTYKGHHEYMSFMCGCGEGFERKPSQLFYGGFTLLCRTCSLSERHGKAHTEERLRSLMENKGATLLSQYVHRKHPLRYKCSVSGCSEEHSVSLESLSKGSGLDFYCEKHILERLIRRGEAHHNWNPNAASRSLAREFFPQWSRLVMALYRYTCAISGKRGSLVAHHLNSKGQFPEQALMIRNGVCLSRELHKEFHLSFCGGYDKGSTLGQFEMFYLFKTGEIFKPIPSRLIISIDQSQRMTSSDSFDYISPQQAILAARAAYRTTRAVDKLALATSF